MFEGSQLNKSDFERAKEMTTTSNNLRVWFITGCSTGFGRALAEAVLSRGDQLIATARKPEQVQDLVEQYPEQAHAIRLDVTDPNNVRESVAEAVQAFGRIRHLRKMVIPLAD